MTNDQMTKLAAWFRSECRRREIFRSDIAEYANSIGITIDSQDLINLFHHLNNEKDFAA